MTVIPKAKPVSPSRADPNSLTLVPASRVDIITSNFVSKISIDDIRYDLTCFGSFLQHVPRRLGSNLALDTSVDAFATASKIFFTGEQSVEALAKYTVAIKALRGCLNDPTASQTPETMCAVYLVMIVQVTTSPFSAILQTDHLDLDKSSKRSIYDSCRRTRVHAQGVSRSRMDDSKIRF